jgi:hypothetical protein
MNSFDAWLLPERHLAAGLGGVLDLSRFPTTEFQQ